MYEHEKSVLYKYWHEHKDEERISIRDKFLALGYPPRSLHRWLTSLEETDSIERVEGSARPPTYATPGNIRKIKAYFENRSGRSQTIMSKRLGCHRTTVGKILKRCTNIKRYKKGKIPKMTSRQKAVARPKCGKMYRMYKNHDFLIDDESYFTFSNTSLAGNDFFYSSDPNSCEESVRYNLVEKFEPKLLVWLAISPKGMTKPVFSQSGLAVNQTMYRDQCLKPKLIPFIRKHYQTDDFIFWPDLASAHCPKSVQEYLEGENVPVVPKEVNPANLPQVRSIEDFWAYLKRIVYEGDWSAKSHQQLETRIRYALTKVDPDFVQKLARDTKRRLDRIRRKSI